MKITTRNRFEKKVFRDWLDNDACHLWTGSLNPKKTGEYGRFRIGNKIELAHRVSYRLYIGKIPDGMQVLHKCDNPRCVNPDHLFLGTQIDNIKDMNTKGRALYLKGENHGMAKLNAEKVFQIRWLAASGYTRRKIAKLYDVAHNNINSIVHNKTWQQECHD